MATLYKKRSMICWEKKVTENGLVEQWRVRRHVLVLATASWQFQIPIRQGMVDEELLPF